MWKPKVGDHVKLSELQFYSALKLHPWGWFEVDELLENACWVHTILCAAGVQSRRLMLAYENLQKPICWQERYEMTGQDQDQAQKMVDWLETRGGISVWACEDLSQAGRLMFTPGDRSTEKPHWSMGLVEVVTDRQRCNIGYEVLRLEKPPITEKFLWTKVRGENEWYRRVGLTDRDKS